MKKYMDGFAILIASAWVGGMWAAGYIAAPVLFQFLPDKSLAGMLAGKLFGVIAYVGMVSAVYLLLYEYKNQGKQALSRSVFRVTLAMLLLVLLGHFGIQPLLAELKSQVLPLYVMDSSNAERFRFWHGAASILFLLQSILGGVLLIKLNMTNKTQ